MTPEALAADFRRSGPPGEAGKNPHPHSPIEACGPAYVGPRTKRGSFWNEGRIHKTLRVIPAMAAGVPQHVWSLEG